MALTDKLTAIADAIRAKTGGTEAMTLDQMPPQIAGIQAGGGGIGAVKFIDVDITVEASTTTAVTYTVDGLEFLSSVENPTKWNAFAFNDAYMAFVTPKEITGTATGEEICLWNKTMRIMYGNTNYTASNLNIFSAGTSWQVNNYGIYDVTLNCTGITDGKPTGNMTVRVRHHPSTGFEVLAGTYNVQVWHLTDWKWGV